MIETIPLYATMINKMPKACLEEIQGLQHKFLWGNTNDHRRIHVVFWDIITKPKVMGGLCLRNLEVLNRVNIMKLGWKITTNVEDLWCKVLRGKYKK